MEKTFMTREDILEIERESDATNALNLLILIGPDNFAGDMNDYERLKKLLARREAFQINKKKEEEC